MKQQLEDVLAEEEERRDLNVDAIDVDDSLAVAGVGTVITLIQHNRWKTNIAIGPTIVSDILRNSRKTFSFLRE